MQELHVTDSHNVLQLSTTQLLILHIPYSKQRSASSCAGSLEYSAHLVRHHQLNSCAESIALTDARHSAAVSVKAAHLPALPKHSLTRRRETRAIFMLRLLQFFAEKFSRATSCVNFL
eukprot:Gregarina_sp_Poly_1__5372@NODE_2838_length_1646_cov_189_671944_g1768_i1_p3_GENE_NODE_2838_length_1646_cov_189_671944_g1768_i1NODE_2838_length_1646_cov_189_671944_g1768_i1_p3_ORF_typecomplete_len118_score5_68_NODE_2838_length_1646_cov_189_671944_g1768_i112891642